MQIVKVAYGVAALALIAVLALRWMTPQPDDVPATAPAMARAMPAVSPSPRHAPVATGSPPPLPASPVPGNWRQMRARFEHATSLRAFFYEAMKNPRDGGYFFAQQVLGLCRIEPPVDTLSSARRDDAAVRLRARCDMSDQEQEDMLRQMLAMRESERDDPLYHTYLDFLSAYGRDGKVEAMRGVIDSGDPALIGLLSFWGLQGKGPDDGYAGRLLVACGLGSDCGANSTTLLSLCAQRGWCGDTVGDALRDGFGADYARIDTLARQALDNIRKGNVAGLVRERQVEGGPPPPRKGD